MIFIYQPTSVFRRCGGVALSLSDFTSKGPWFPAGDCIESCCFLRQETLFYTVFFNPGSVVLGWYLHHVLLFLNARNLTPCSVCPLRARLLKEWITLSSEESPFHWTKINKKKYTIHWIGWGRGGVVVSALDLRSEGRWFDVHSLSSCCFLRQETLHYIVSLRPGV